MLENANILSKLPLNIVWEIIFNIYLNLEDIIAIFLICWKVSKLGLTYIFLWICLNDNIPANISLITTQSTIIPILDSLLRFPK